MGKKWKGIDKRAFVRHPTEIPIQITAVNLKGSISQNLIDISQGGISFKSPHKFSKGEVVEITIPFVTPLFKSKGTVVWSRRDGKSYEIGLQFHNTDDSFRLRMVEQICYIEAYRKKQLEMEGRELTSDEAAIEWIERYASSFPGNEK